jgi:uncharacterized membrane protein YeaQ/YmgE (transglycosylase-associated protein family)
MGDGRHRLLAFHGIRARPVLGGIIGAFLAALAGALVSGFVLPEPGIGTANPPGAAEAIWAIPGAVFALIASYLYEGAGTRRAGFVRN